MLHATEALRFIDAACHTSDWEHYQFSLHAWPISAHEVLPGIEVLRVT